MTYEAALSVCRGMGPGYAVVLMNSETQYGVFDIATAKEHVARRRAHSIAWTS